MSPSMIRDATVCDSPQQQQVESSEGLVEAIPEERVFAHGERVKGKVVIITGGSNGIGKETALRFASHGAKVVIGDLDEAGGQKTVAQIALAGGSATFIRTNVTQWDSQVALFEHARATYGGAVDVVVVNAGTTDSEYGTVRLDAETGKPLPPNMRTIDVNVTGACYTTHLALHYLGLNQQKGDLKSLILIGSMASWQGIPNAELYTTSKHAVLGLMRGLESRLELLGIRVACVHPFFADTDIVPVTAKLLLAGIPLVPVPRIAGAIFYAATDPDPSTSAASWVCTDEGPAVLVRKESFKLGVYGMLDARVNAITRGVKGVAFGIRLARHLWNIGRPLQKYAVAAGLAGFVWYNQAQLETLGQRLQAL